MSICSRLCRSAWPKDNRQSCESRIYEKQSHEIQSYQSQSYQSQSYQIQICES